MKYTVCYNIYRNIVVEAENEDQAFDIATDNIVLPERSDGFEITMIEDENGNQIYY